MLQTLIFFPQITNSDLPEAAICTQNLPLLCRFSVTNPFHRVYVAQGGVGQVCSTNYRVRWRKLDIAHEFL
jgi:hypothetical protein